VGRPCGSPYRLSTRRGIAQLLDLAGDFGLDIEQRPARSGAAEIARHDQVADLAAELIVEDWGREPPQLGLDVDDGLSATAPAFIAGLEEGADVVVSLADGRRRAGAKGGSRRLVSVHDQAAAAEFLPAFAGAEQSEDGDDGPEGDDDQDDGPK
jgi:hypothetical protein